MRAYLLGRVRLSYLTPLLMLVVTNLAATDAASHLMVIPLILAMILLFVRSSRRACYATLFVCLTLFAYAYVFEVAPGPQDPRSDRDEQLEVATRAFLVGENPWNHRSTTGNQITAGPPGVLAALVPVALFDRIDSLTFLFYLAFFGLLLLGDLIRRNDSFPLLVLLFLAGAFGFRHTMIMSLEELYFWFVVLALGWILLERGQVTMAGACLAIPLLARMNYAFPVVGFLCWYWHSGKCSNVGLMRLGLGAAMGTTIVMAPFLIVGGTDFIGNNPWFDATERFVWGWQETNVVFRMLNRLHDAVGARAMFVLKLVVTLPMQWWAARRLARLGQHHPFWDMALGALAANLLVVTAKATVADYLLFPVLPAFLAFAFTKGLSGARADVREQPEAGRGA